MVVALLCFVFSAGVAGLGVLAVLAGVAVALYLRHEAMKEYEREDLRFEKLRRIFEQQKRDFVQSL